MKKYYMIECKLTNGITRYFCVYRILDTTEIRFVKNKNEAIYYTEKELEKAEIYLLSLMTFQNIVKYNFVKV